KSLFELRTAHLVAVHEQAHRLAHKPIFAVHRPGHDRLVALGLKREVHGGSAFHRPLPIHPHSNQFTGFALDNGAASGANVAVTIPTADRAHSSIGAA